VVTGGESKPSLRRKNGFFDRHAWQNGQRAFGPLRKKVVSCNWRLQRRVKELFIIKKEWRAARLSSELRLDINLRLIGPVDELSEFGPISSASTTASVLKSKVSVRDRWNRILESSWGLYNHEITFDRQLINPNSTSSIESRKHLIKQSRNPFNQNTTQSWETCATPLSLGSGG
jgi:hypothetical protein